MTYLISEKLKAVNLPLAVSSGNNLLDVGTSVYGKKCVQVEWVEVTVVLASRCYDFARFQVVLSAKVSGSSVFSLDHSLMYIGRFILKW